MDIEFSHKNFSKINQQIKNGSILVMPTDTIYGFSGNPNDISVIEQIQKLKKRPAKKPFLLLVGNLLEVEKIVDLDKNTKNLLQKIWPGPCTFILKRKKNVLNTYFPKEQFLAIRIPKNKILLDFLNKYWKKPLVSTSVNISGKNPETDIENIKKIFQKDQNITYCNNANSNKNTDLSFATSNVSTIVKIENGKIIVIREGVLSKNNIEILARQFFGK